MEQSAQGFTVAQSGLVRLGDGRRVFVKCAMDDNSAYWAKKELKAYQKLREDGYEHLPRVLAVNADGTSFALEDLSQYDFSSTWDTDKLHALMRARKDLKSHKDLFDGDADFSMRSVVGTQNRWPTLAQDGRLLDQANTILQACGQAVQVSSKMAERCQDVMRTWSVHQDTLVHDDLRADNFAYDPATKTGKLIDWTWLCVGDDTLDTSSLFVSVVRSQFPVYEMYPDLFSEQAIVSILGYWLEVLGSSGDQVTDARRSQAMNIRICYDLLAERTQLTVA